MKKTTKGAIAAAAAGVLLLGGAGTIAFWSDSSTISGGTVETGTLSLTDAECGADWVYADGNASVGETVDLIVPGDVISKECTFVVSATGDNLAATLTTPEEIGFTTSTEADADPDTFEATVAAAYTVGEPATAMSTTITSANDTDVVTATITVTFPFGTADDGKNANDTQAVTATLNEIEVTLVQTET